MKGAAGNAIGLNSRVTEASAGTGKTTELVNFIIEILRAGASAADLVAVTFTHAAAGEMKLRLRHELEKHCQAETDPVLRQRLGSALEHLEEAFVGTIHSFCAQLLHQRPVEAGVDPDFREMSPLESSRLFGFIFRKWLGERLSVEPATLQRAFARLAWLEDKKEDPSKLLRDQAWRLAEWRDLGAKWTLRPFDRLAETNTLLNEIVSVVDEWRKTAGTLQYVPGPLRPAINLAETVELQRASGIEDYNVWEAELCSLLNRQPTPHDFRFLRDVEANRKNAIIQRFRTFVEAVRQYKTSADADFAVRLRDELWPVVERYQLAKHRSGLLDFTDLLLCARDLMKNDDARTWLQARYQHLFVDEFQDTDPLQAEMILLLSSSDPSERDWRHVVPTPGKLFIVGDPKQSIYRFRRAEVALYRHVSEQLRQASAETSELRKNFRSNQQLEEFVNAAFGDRIPQYLPLEDGRDPIPSQASVISLPIPHIQGKRGEVTKTAIEASAPRATAAFIDWLVNKSDWKRSRRNEPPTKITESDICILFRRFTAAVTRDYVRELENRGLTHVLIGSKSLHDREEVMVLRTALTAIEWPDDLLNVFAVVRGALFAISDSTLIKFRHIYGPLNPFKILPTSLDMEFEPVVFALSVIRDLHKKRNYRPIATTIADLLERTRAHAGFALRPGGERVLANVTRLVDLARRYEATAATSFRSFVEYLHEEADSGEANEAPLLEHDADGVKLMTVHKAKGLEFPVVILADPTAKLTDGDMGDRYIDHDAGVCAQRLLRCAPWDLIEHRAAEAQAERDEADRIAYVAATRARDILVVESIGTQEWDGWLSPLNAAVYPPREAWRGGRQTSWCTFAGENTVLDWQTNGANSVCVKPGLHSPRSGNHDVLWFDPSQLELDTEANAGIANKNILQGDPTEGLKRYNEWKARRTEIVERGARPTFEIITATSGSAESEDNLLLETVSIQIDRARPRGPRFGTLVHRLLRDADFGSRDDVLERIARVHGEGIGASENEINSSVAVVRAILGHPLVSAAGRSSTTHREYPFVYKDDNGKIVEGNIDLVFQQADEWIIVDFKTGPSERLEYRTQVAVYARALRPRRVRAVLFEVQ
jgi:ATP-dependent exoDNAse (exonuclease V) beta subunit